MRKYFAMIPKLYDRRIIVQELTLEITSAVLRCAIYNPKRGLDIIVQCRDVASCG